MNEIKKNEIDVAALEVGLGGLPIEIFAFDIIDSTNNEAKRMAREGYSSMALVIAAEQSGGRGRMGRSFYSPAETGLYFTLLFPSPENTLTFARLTSAAAVALRRGIVSVFGVDTGIKWVNDLYIGHKKVAGILAECFDGDGGKKMIALGMGVNICTRDFPEEIVDKAGALCGSHGGREALATATAREFFSIMRDISDGNTEYMNEYRSASVVVGRDIIFAENGEEYRAFAEDVDSMGFLRIVLPDGKRRTLSSGEISVKVEGRETEV